MTARWLSSIEACQVLGISQSTLRRRIDKGEIETKPEHGKRLILVTTDNHVDTISLEADMVMRLQSEVDLLREQVKQKDDQINKLQEELRESRERSDTIIMTLTRQVQDAQQLASYWQQPFWRRWGKQKRLSEGRKEG